MSQTPHILPIEPILPALIAALSTHKRVVLEAPPGAGKSTRVPHVLHDSGLFAKKILMLEPRRLAAKATAHRIAQNMGTEIGALVGYRMRGDTQAGKDTKIEVVTEGILARIAQNDPELSEYDCVIFDEFHERSLHADFGLALVMDIKSGLRDDLAVLVMSATLDAAPIAAHLDDAPIIRSQGRSYPIERQFLDKPWRQAGKGLLGFETAMADLIQTAFARHHGSLLAFLPGEGEIRKVQKLLETRRLPADIHPLYGALPFAQQQDAIAPTKARKIVLATSIAETSLTIQSITIVVDGGLARRARFDPSSGMTRLITERVTKAEATQRAGRAGRLEAGFAYALWTKGEDAGLIPHPEPEIRDSDLVPMVLNMAEWGAYRAQDLPFLTPPRDSDVTIAQDILTLLGAFDASGKINARGLAMAKQPTHPRLARLLSEAGKDGPRLAALIEGRDVLNRGAPVDFSLRLQAIQNSERFEKTRPYKIAYGAMKAAKTRAKGLKAQADQDRSLAQALALAYPDRIGVRRKGKAPRFHLSSGKGATLPNGDAFANEPYLVVIGLDGGDQDALIRQALPISRDELNEIFQDQLAHIDACHWSKQHNRVIAERQIRLGAATLAQENWANCPDERKIDAMLDGIRTLGLNALPWERQSKLILSRIRFANGAQGLPDASEEALLAGLENWLGPYLLGVDSKQALGQLNMAQIMQGFLSWEQSQTLEQIVPASFKAPSGTNLKIDYSKGQPQISVRLQELYGLEIHPTVNGQALLIELLSPAQRPVQLTQDLPGFWVGSYSDVRKDMRARYPKHDWPEDPSVAQATTRLKRRP